MRGFFLSTVSQKSTQITFFVFFSLIFLSVSFFVFAETSDNGKNIFQDADQDGLSNDEEKLYGTDPNKKDTDGDGYTDGIEIESGYNPLKKAPGDKIVNGSLNKNDNTSSVELAAMTTDENNLTVKVSSEIANVLKNVDPADPSVTMEQVNVAVQNALSENQDTIVLPEINIKDIKIKKAPSKSLKEKERKEKERKDVVEYLTVMAYIMANNSPKTFQTTDDFTKILTSLSEQSIAEISTGNISYVDQLAEKGKKILDETKDREVPEAMLDVHVKALQMAEYAIQVKEELRPEEVGIDPIGQIATLSKIQGFLGVVLSFSEEVQNKMVEYDIDTLPIDL